MNKKYEIDEKELIELISSQRKLDILNNNGVDNWEGYQEIDEEAEFDEEDILDFIEENYKLINKEKEEKEND
nr:MAG TPA: hypothetical protein [Caudoviricetes sp.]